MSKKATEFQKKEMSKMYRGKEIFKPLNTGWVDEHVACVREWVANIFFYRKGDTTIMIDAGYNYDRLAEKMGWLGIDPQSIRHILIPQSAVAEKTGLIKDFNYLQLFIQNRFFLQIHLSFLEKIRQLCKADAVHIVHRHLAIAFECDYIADRQAVPLKILRTGEVEHLK